MDTHFSLSWDAYQKNICSGLSALQQRGEFVDMTLAADGHHAKVHQMVLSLVSPYIKDLISSAQCPHPVIFLNNISYITLCQVLEYIYTGEVYLPKHSLSDFLAAGRALHIKGIQDMEETNVFQGDTKRSQDNTGMTEQDAIVLQDDDSTKNHTKSQTNEETPQITKKTLLEQLQKCKENKKHDSKLKGQAKSVQPLCKVFVDDSNQDIIEEFTDAENDDCTLNDEDTKSVGSSTTSDIVERKELSKNSNIVQYSLSNQGGLQLIFNRYIYALKYVQKKLIKFWRCADSGSKKCPANIYTNQRNQVIKRTFNHNHPFHDKNILKKMRRGLVFKVFKEAESRALGKKDKEVLRKVDETYSE